MEVTLREFYNQFNRACSEVEGLEKRVSELESSLDQVASELVRLKEEKRPDRSPIPIPSLPNALKSIGVGMRKQG